MSQGNATKQKSALIDENGDPLGTPTNPIRTDSTGSTTQPASNAAASQADGHSTNIGALADADTASTLTGLLKYIKNRIPASLLGGRFDINLGSWFGSTAPTVGQKSSASSVPAVLSNDVPLANAYPAKITDATNGPAAVKAGSTAPVAGDEALVVVLSPNQPAIPVTSAPISSTPRLVFGMVTLTNPTAGTPIRKTTYNEQSSNFTGSIASSDSNDSSAGTGARTVRITWVNSAGTTIGTEDVTLNGTTYVDLVNSNKCFIEKMEVLTVGSGGDNAGVITLKAGAAGAGATVGTIAAGDNGTRWAHHYVPSGVISNVTSMLHGNTSTVSGGVSAAFLKTQVPGQVEKQVTGSLIVAGASNSLSRNFGSQVQVTGPARITMYTAVESSATIDYYGSFDLYDVDAA